MSVGRVLRAYGALGTVGLLLDGGGWYEVGVGADGRPTLRLDPLAATVYAERPDMRVHPEDLDMGVVADALGLSADHVQGFVHGSEGSGLDEAKEWCSDYLTSPGVVAAFEQGHAEGALVRRALLSA